MRPFLFGLALLHTVATFSSTLYAWVYYEVDGKRVTWPPQKCMVSYVIQSDGLDQIPGFKEFETIQQAAEKWNQIECNHLEFKFKGLEHLDTSLEAQTEDGKNSIVFVTSGWALLTNHSPLDVALTVLTYHKPEMYITDADIHVNAQMYSFAICSSTTENTVDFEYTITHEFGHIFGLAHSTDPDSIMYVHEAFCKDKPPHFPTQDDQEGICAVYNEEWAQDCNAGQAESQPDNAEHATPLPDNPEPEVVDVVGTNIETATNTQEHPHSCGSCEIGGELSGYSFSLYTVVAFLSVLLCFFVFLRRSERTASK